MARVRSERSVRDVVLVPISAWVDADPAGCPPAGDPPFELAEGLHLTTLSDECRLDADQVMLEGDLVINACQQRGYNHDPTPQHGWRYAFVRTVDYPTYEADPFGWDGDDLLWTAVVLSRLVRDNGYSLEYAARIIMCRDEVAEVIPVGPGGVATHRLRPRERDWLTYEEACQLRDLLDRFIRVNAALPQRVFHAVNLSEDAMRLGFAERFPLLIGIGLEALINTEERGPSRQFRERLPQLAAEVGVTGVNEEFARELYGARSHAAHGQEVAMPPSAPPGRSWAGARSRLG